MKKPLHKVRTRLHTMTPGHSIRKLGTRRVVQKLADDLGMVYFGYVDQRQDEHHLIRGFTASSTHRDHHYTVGTYKGYDVSMVIRRDNIEFTNGHVAEQFWTIMTFDLKSGFDLPHFHILHHKMKEQFAAKYLQLSEVPRSSFVGHEPRFFDFYTIYGKLEKLQEHCELISPDITKGILENFNGMSVEVSDDTLHLYFTSKHPTRPELERMLRCGVWLSQVLDENSRRCYVRFD